MSRMADLNDLVHLPISGAVGVATFCFLLYWFTAYSQSYKRIVSSLIGEGHVEKYLPFYQKGLGVLLIGFFPGILLWVLIPDSFTEYGLVLKNPRASFFWVLGFGATLFWIPFFSARKSEMQAIYPQIRIACWDVKLIVVNALIWAVYLFTYEFLFRSFLLCSLLNSLDTLSAIVIATAISVATHMPKGAAETFGTIPFSVMLCLAMVSTGSIWAGFFIHLILALSNDFWALFFNPEMWLEKRGESINQV